MSLLVITELILLIRGRHHGLIEFLVGIVLVMVVGLADCSLSGCGSCAIETDDTLLKSPLIPINRTPHLLYLLDVAHGRHRLLAEGWVLVLLMWVQLVGEVDAEAGAVFGEGLYHLLRFDMVASGHLPIIVVYEDGVSSDFRNSKYVFFVGDDSRIHHFLLGHLPLIRHGKS